MVRILYTGLLLLVYPVCVVFSMFHSKLKEGVWGRMGQLRRLRRQVAGFSKKPYWFHFASSGEFEQCLPILESLKADKPETPIFLTYFSPSAKKALLLETERRKQWGSNVPWDASGYLPWDFPWTMNAFVTLLRPRCFVVIHREIWPNCLKACQKKRIPCYLFATHFSDKAKRFFSLYRPFLKQFRGIGTTQLSTREWLDKELKSRPIEHLGDPRIDRVLTRKHYSSQKQLASWKAFVGERPIFLFGSLWKEDLEKLKPGLEFLFRQNQWRLMIVPHQIEDGFLSEIENFFHEHQQQLLRFSKWSQSKSPDLKAHLLVDSVGQLAELYSVSQRVFVGGSFKGKVHNVLEPAAYGSLIFTGPYIENSPEAMEMWKVDKALLRLENSQGLLDWMEQFEKYPDQEKVLQDRVMDYVQERRGAGHRYGTLLSPL